MITCETCNNKAFNETMGCKNFSPDFSCQNWKQDENSWAKNCTNCGWESPDATSGCIEPTRLCMKFSHWKPKPDWQPTPTNQAETINDDFEKLLQAELDKLPYTKHLDDGQYNDGKQVGFELGARWAVANMLSIAITYKKQWQRDGFNAGREKENVKASGQLVTYMDKYIDFEDWNRQQNK